MFFFQEDGVHRSGRHMVTHGSLVRQMSSRDNGSEQSDSLFSVTIILCVCDDRKVGYHTCTFRVTRSNNLCFLAPAKAPYKKMHGSKVQQDVLHGQVEIPRNLVIP